MTAISTCSSSMPRLPQGLPNASVFWHFEGAPVLFALELQRVAALAAEEKAREYIGTASSVLRLNPAAFQQGDDFRMLFRRLDRWMRTLDDDPVFAGNHFEGSRFAFLVQSTACLAIDHPA
nr:hypothetical protein [Alicyclobacillus cycloheptanicus]